MTSLFITGASGFIGSHLLSNIDTSMYENIYCLTRNKEAISEINRGANLQWIEGDLHHSQAYLPYLRTCNTVMHLAATTGKSAPETYFSVNANGTQALLKKCQEANIKNFFHVSTIAVKYKNNGRYHYAQSKEMAEIHVKNSGLNYVIVRPTIVIGQEAEGWKSLVTLASSSIVPLFNGGKVIIQPIYIDDLVSCLLSILYGKLFTNNIYELGGPERIRFSVFLKKIHDAYRNKQGWFPYIPLAPLVGILSIIETFHHSLLPINTGQLSVFMNDSTIDANDVFYRHRHQMKSIDDMLSLVIQHDKTQHQ